MIAADLGRLGRTATHLQPGQIGQRARLRAQRTVLHRWPTEVLVRTAASVISPGTEWAVTALAQASLIAKARVRPDLVSQVVHKARTEGLSATRRAVRGRLAEDLALGYSAAGVVIETGPAVTGVRPGQLVATGGAGKANHAEFQTVPGLLCAAVPDGVPGSDAAFTTIASIALHALRVADAGPGSKSVLLGLGLIAQLAARLAMAAGCDVAGIDPAAYPGAAGPPRACSLLMNAASRLRTRCSPGRADGARMRCWCARPGGPHPPCCGPGAVPGPGDRGDRRRCRAATGSHAVLRAGTVAAVCPVVRLGPV